eukprot:TRINITY_DN11604_c0_g2_i1.p2 TRINITY_DN11604_c0_g2~~TRINITY_DN11604_c0_g2_i1.p2  ORF type:complete len:152 (+),score=31.48 TRINITY_DN11604_c0_g2_i1:103-558(+)
MGDYEESWTDWALECVIGLKQWLCDGWVIMLLLALGGLVVSAVDLCFNHRERSDQRIFLTSLGGASCALLLVLGFVAAKKRWKRNRRRGLPRKGIGLRSAYEQECLVFGAQRDSALRRRPAADQEGAAAAAGSHAGEDPALQVEMEERACK